jgi:tetratricopeptide (TPR) repeat protein
MQKHFVTLVVGGLLCGFASGAYAGAKEDYAACDGAVLKIVISVCNKVIDNPKQSAANRAIAYGNRGWGNMEAGNVAKALQDAEASIALDSSNAYVFNNRGIIYFTRSDFEKAAADFSAVIKLDPKNADGWNNRSAAMQNLKQFQNALSDVNQALKLNPKYVLAYANRIETYHALGQVDKASAEAEALVKRFPKDAGAYAIRGWIKRKIGDLDAAIADGDRSVKLKPEDANFRDKRGASLLAKGRNAEAIADFSKAIELSPEDPSLYQQRGRAKLAMSDYPGARTDADKALVMRPGDADNQKLVADIQTAMLALSTTPSEPPPAAKMQDQLPPETTAEVPQILATPKAPAKLPVLGRRVALVMGNSAYGDGMALSNPVNDATAMAASLKRLGFDVVFATNATKVQMTDAMYQFAVKAEDADAALVFYAGHGMQVDGVNYLMPVDGSVETKADLKHKFVAADDILDDLKSVKGMRMMVLDACRNNPLSRSIKLKLAKVASRSVDNRAGLADMKAEGVLIAFATQPNEVAADGDGKNSPFTMALLKHIETPNIEIDTMFKRARTTASEMTEGAQLPQTVNSSTGEFYLKQE